MIKKTFIVLMVIFAIAFYGPAGAATYSDFVSGDLNLSRPALEPHPDWVPFYQHRQFDFSSGSLNDGSGVTQGDVVRLFNVGENVYITEFGYRLVTPVPSSSGASATVGDGTNADGYVTMPPTGSGTSMWAVDFTLNAFAGTTIWGLANSGGTNQGVFFSTGGASLYAGSDTIDMTIYTNKEYNVTSSYSGVTPIFEAYIKGFKRITP